MDREPIEAACTTTSRINWPLTVASVATEALCYAMILGATLGPLLAVAILCLAF